MSSHLTEHYQLHTWEPGDDFLRTEFNENFEAIDGIPEVVSGMYTGDGALSRFIELGFRPRAVLVVDSAGAMQSSQACYGGLAADGFPVIYAGTTLVEIGEGGFQVARGYQNGNAYWADTNNGGKTYHYLAVKV